MNKLKRGEMWNIANLITFFRMGLLPIVMVLLHYESPITTKVALVLFIIAAVSDLVDGYLARKYQLESILGAFLDPLADKLLVLGVMILLIPLNRIPAWMVAIFILRDMTITALRGIAASEGMIISASRWGKYKTTYEAVALGFLIYHYPIMGVKIHEIGLMLLWIGMFLALGSGYDYLRQFFRAALE